MDLTHVTLTSGHVRTSPRREVQDAVLATLDGWLRDVLGAPGHVDVPTPAGDLIRAHVLETPGRGLVVTLSMRLEADLAPLVTMSVGPGRNPMLWQQLALAARSPLAEPPAPWCAVILYPTLEAAPYAVEWLGDFERCLAWAWVAFDGGRS